MKATLLALSVCVFTLPAFAQRQALFLTSATPPAGDLAISNRLASLGFVVTRVVDTASQTSDANGKDLIVVSSSVGSGNIGTKFTAVAVPLINCEQAIYDELGIDVNNVGGATVGGQTQINIVDCTHPLAGGLPGGPVTVYVSAGPIVVQGTPVASAQIVATVNDGTGRPSVFGIEAGAALNPVRIATAPARRVGAFWEATTFLTADGLKLFDAAVAWAIGAPPSPTAPIGLTQQPASATVNEQVAVTFSVGFTGAPPYFIQWQRSDGAGGFTNIPGATCPSYNTGPTIPADNGAMFRASVSNEFSAAVSAAATLNVITDTTPPMMVLALGGGVPPTSFDVVYSELVDAMTAAEPLNYLLANGALVLSATLDADGRTVHLTSEPITNGTLLTINSPVYDRAFTPNALNPGDPGASISIITTDGSIRRHQFNIGGGVTLSVLTNHFRFPSLPDVIDFPTLFETPVNAADNYGVHFLGYVTAPVSGNYHFYMSSDDAGALFLSTDANPMSKRLIAFEPQWAASREWVGNAGNPAGRNAAAPQNQSRTLFPEGIPLEKGQRYFIEAMMKEGTGGDNLAVAWQRPGDPVPVNGSSPIPGIYLSRFDQPAAVGAGEPADQVVFEARQATFAVTPSGSPPLSFQWYENDLLISGATGPTYVTPLLSTTDSGKTYYVIVSNPFSSVTSRVATLTVNMDNTGPVLLSASSVHSMDIGLCFDEALDPATAGNAINYTVNGGAVSVASATLRYDGRTVQLVLGGPISGTFTVQVNNVLDLTGRNMIAAGSSASGSSAGLTPADLATPGDPIAIGSTFSCRPGEFEIIAGGSDIWGTADHGHLAYQTIEGNFDKRVLIARIDNTDVSAKGGLMVRETTGADSRNLHAIVMPPPPARNIYETGTRAAAAGATAGWGILGGANGNVAATHPNSWIRFRRVGNTFSAYVSTNGTDWTKNGESIQSYPAEVVFGLCATSHNNDGRTNRVLFQNYGDTAYPGATVTITQNPANVAGEQNHPVRFTVQATVAGAPASELAFQWQRDNGAGGFTNIFGANESNYTFVAALSDHGAQLRAIAFVPGASATSASAMLTVTNDVTPPTLVSATRGCADATMITLVYSEFVEIQVAEDHFSYKLFDTSGQEFVITNRVLQADGRTVLLTTELPLPNTSGYTLTVLNVIDLVGNQIAPDSKILVSLAGGRIATGPQNLVVIEAENYDAKVPQGGKDWVFRSNPVGVGSISGAGYMQALPESGAAINEPSHLTQSPRLDYCVNFPVSGRWYVWLRGNDVTTGANSVHVGINNTDSADLNDNRLGNSGGATGWGNPAGASSPWQWTRDADVNTRVAWITVPSAGLHTFNIWMREDSVVVDKLLLTTDSSFVLTPNTILGPAESPREVIPPPPVNMVISRAGNMVTISWTPQVGTLQQADQITGEWTNVSAGTNPYSVNADQAKKFYRIFVQ